METKEIYILERAALTSEFWAGAAAPRLIGLYGCIRYKHIQCSFLIQECEWGWIFICIAGKFVVGGRRQPLIWAPPKVDDARRQGYASSRRSSSHDSARRQAAIPPASLEFSGIVARKRHSVD